MPSNTQYRPLRNEEFQSDQVNFNGQSVFGACEENQSVSTDLTMMDDHLLTGGNFIVKGGKFGDKVTLQVIHPVAGVVGQYVTHFGIKSDVQDQFNLSLTYPAKIFTGLKLRVLYISTGEVGIREFCINYYLHKVLF